ncbi:hypothetical protein GCM10027047_01040 [Rhodococcus aerolatus]
MPGASPLYPPLGELVEAAGLSGAPPGSGFAVQSPTAKIVAASVESQEILGVTLDQLQGRQSQDPRWSSVDAQGRRVPGSQHPSVRAVRSGVAVQALLGVYRPGSDDPGRHVWLDVTAVPLVREGETTPWAAVSAFTPVTGERLAVLALQDSERLHRLVAENSSDMVAWQLLDSTFLWASPSYLDGLGHHPDDLVGTRSDDLVHPDDVSVADHVRRVLEQGGELTAVRKRMRHRDGGYRWIETTAHVVTGGDDEPQVVTSRRDVTTRVEAEAERDAAVRLFEVAMETATIGVALRRLDGTLTRVNTALCTFLGRPTEELVGHALAEFASDPAAVSSSPGVLAVAAGELASHESEHTFLRPDGSVVWGLRTIVRLPAVGGVRHLLVQLQDITARKAAAAELARAAVTDALTGLANRVVLVERISRSLERAGRGGSEVGVLFVDLDHFRIVNETLGHDVGDDLLQQVARRLSGVVRSTDTLGRLGGDEFVVVREDVEHVVQLDELGDRICAVLAEPFQAGGHDVAISASVGTVTGSSGTARDLLARADEAVFGAKRSGRGRVNAHAEATEVAAVERLILEGEVADAVRRDELVLHYQPIVALGHSASPVRVVAREALLRWQHPERGLLAPAEFLPVTERGPLTVPVGEWVLRHACRDAAGWDDDAVVHVNVSPRHLASSGFVEHVGAVLAETGLPAARLCLEITETLVLTATRSTLAAVDRVTELGVALALDDFGTGQSSITALHRLPIDAVKVDRSFVADLENPTAAGLVDGLVQLSSAMGLDCVAEGVETPEQAVWLADHGCTTVQGFLFGRPAPLTGPGGPTAAPSDELADRAQADAPGPDS